MGMLNWTRALSGVRACRVRALISSVYTETDIVARVFNLKLKALIQEIDGGIFGRCVARVHTIEYQKRGLHKS